MNWRYKQLPGTGYGVGYNTSFLITRDLGLIEIYTETEKRPSLAHKKTGDGRLMLYPPSYALHIPNMPLFAM